MRDAVFFLLGLLLLSVAQAEPLRVDLEKEISRAKPTNLYDLDPKVKDSKLPILSRLKYFEIKKRWKDCAALGPKVISTHADVSGWVAQTWLKCELKNFEANKNKKELERPLAWLRKHKNVLVEGPWQKSLWEDFVGASLRQLDSDRNPAKVIELLDFEERLSKEARGQLLSYMGEFAEKKSDNKKAFYFYEQSLIFKENKAARDRYEALKKTLGIKTDQKPVLDGSGDAEGAEAALEENMNRQIANGDPLAALKTSVVLQVDYVGSRVARRLKDKPFEIYQDIFNSVSNEEKQNKAFRELEKVGALRLAEWSQILHRKANYDQALAFAESALKQLYMTPQSTNLYWIAGRAAHLTGEYDRAQANFAKLIEFHAGTEEAAEALLRSGLIHLRLKNYTSAKNQFEKLLEQKRERYDLLARYWLVRSLESIDKEKAGVEAKTLIERYPFSYYGLRLTAEANNGEYQWPQKNTKPNTPEAALWLIGNQVKAWSRFKTLSNAGWIIEAQAESQQFPGARNPSLEFLLAKYMALNYQYPQAVRLMAEAMDADGSLKTGENLAFVYPKSYSALIDAEAKKYNLNPILVRSLIRQESAFGVRAQSTSNAQGLMQLIPPTAQDVARRLALKKIELPEDVYRPEINIPLGTFYISQMIEQFSGNVPFALGAYNAGPTKMKIFTEGRGEIKALVAKASSDPLDEIWFDELPWTETSFYIKAILRNSLLYKLIDAAKIDWSLVLWQDLHDKKANSK